MGKFKVSFTTALFVFSFLVCVIVAVVFVDRTPKNDYDSFYDKESPGADARKNRGGTTGGGWDPSSAPAPVAQSPAAPPPDATFADLPIDAHLAGLAQPVAPTVTPTFTPNLMAGRHPEEIARALMGKAGVGPAAQAAAVPGLAVPAGIATPAGGAAANGPAAPAAAAPSYLPMQSNVQGDGPGPMAPNSMGYGGPLATTGRAKSSGDPGGLSNTGPGAWSPVAPQSSSPNMIGVHKAPASSQAGMMISSGRMESGAQAPPGFSDAPTKGGTVPVPSLQGSPATALPGSAQKPLLLPPQGAADNKWELPPAPTLRPPPVQDPDNRRSEADQTPDSLNPSGESGQALSVLEPPESSEALVAAAIADTTPGASESAGAAADGTPAAEQAPAETAAAQSEPAKPAENVAAQVRDRVLTKDQALRLAEVEYDLQDKKLNKDEREEQAAKAAEAWKTIAVSAEQARHEGITVGLAEVEKYAAMQKDFEPSAWQMAMADHGFSEAQIRQDLEDMALSEKLVESRFEKDVEKDAIRKAYDKSPSKYAVARRVQLQEIYKKKPHTEDGAAKVAREMERLRRQAASGTDFGLLARQTSDAPTRKRGGALGWIDTVKDKDADREKAIKDLKPGEVSEVLEEPDGFRLYRLADVKEASKDFEGGQEFVIADLKEPIREKCYAEALEKLEAGELNGAAAKSGSALAATAPAKAVKSPVVATRVGSSLGQTQEIPVPEAPAADGASAPPGNSGVAAAGSRQGEAQSPPAEDDAESERKRKFRAQELLAEVSARRQAAEKGIPYVPKPREPEADAAPAAPTTVMHAPGAQGQLLYAPGTQVQDLSGGQPQQPNLAGGQTPLPVQNMMQANSQASQDFGSMPTTIQPGTPQAMATGMQGATVMQPAAGQTYGAESGSAALPADITAEQAAIFAARQGAGPIPKRPPETRTSSNGWNVSKFREDVPTAPGANTPGSPDSANPNAPKGQEAAAPDMPPGFGGTGAGAENGNTEKPKRGIAGRVKSFLGGLGR